MKVYIVLWRNGRNWAKKTYFAAIFERFSGYALLRPMSYVSIFGQMKAISPKTLSDFAQIFTRGSTKGDKNSVWIIFEKFEFLLKQEIPKVCPFSPTLSPISTWRLVWHFLYALFLCFWTDLINFGFLILWGLSGALGDSTPGLSEGEKLAGSGGKNLPIIHDFNFIRKPFFSEPRFS